MSKLNYYIRLNHIFDTTPLDLHAILSSSQRYRFADENKAIRTSLTETCLGILLTCDKKLSLFYNKETRNIPALTKHIKTLSLVHRSEAKKAVIYKCPLEEIPDLKLDQFTLAFLKLSSMERTDIGVGLPAFPLERLESCKILQEFAELEIAEEKQPAKEMMRNSIPRLNEETARGWLQQFASCSLRQIEQDGGDLCLVINKHSDGCIIYTIKNINYVKLHQARANGKIIDMKIIPSSAVVQDLTRRLQAPPQPLQTSSSTTSSTSSSSPSSSSSMSVPSQQSTSSASFFNSSSSPSPSATSTVKFEPR